MSPSPRSASTSRSRAVSWSRPSSCTAGVVTSASTRPATAGSSTEPPRCTVRMADSSSAGGTSLPSQPLAPARTAARAWSSAPKLVSTMTRGAGSSASRRGRAATPPPPGITRSSSTTSGAGALGLGDRLVDVAGLADHLQPSREPRNERSPSRTTGWSSTISEPDRRRSSAPAPCARTVVPPPGVGLDRQRAAQVGRPLAHRHQPEAARADRVVARDRSRGRRR